MRSVLSFCLAFNSAFRPFLRFFDSPRFLHPAIPSVSVLAVRSNALFTLAMLVVLLLSFLGGERVLSSATLAVVEAWFPIFRCVAVWPTQRFSSQIASSRIYVCGC